MDNKKITFGEKAADVVAAFVGSWKFIIIQAFMLTTWLILNIIGFHTNHWDPYPFILLNLVLSFQAAFTAPVIMISQNRQETIQKRQDQYLLSLMEAIHAQIQTSIHHMKEEERRNTKLLKTLQSLSKTKSSESDD